MIEKTHAWRFTGKVVDFSGVSQRCAYCGDQHLRFGYQLTAGKKPHYAYVGYDCLIKRGFRLGCYDVESLAESKSRLQIEASRRAAIRELVRANENLAANGLSLDRLVHSYRTYGRFSPKQAVFLLSVCRKYQHDFPPALLNVTTKEKQHRNQLATMSARDQALIRPHLTTSQLRWMREPIASQTH